MPSRKKHSDEPHWYMGYNESSTINNQGQQFKKSLSQSYYEINNIADDYDDDAWSKDDLLFKDNLREVLAKWENLDDGIWSKIICMERNRRVAKAYARFKKLTINGSDCCFDGHIIGLRGFENPFRDPSTVNVLSSIGSSGLTIKIDGEGNVWVQHNCHCSVMAPQGYNQHQRTFRGDTHSTAIGRELENCSGRLTANKWFKLFDMARFRDNVIKEMSSTYPDMASLQFQCISVLSFGSNGSNILESPSSILIINILALDMLRARLCPKSESTSKPIKESLKHVAGSVWQSVRRLATRSSKRNSLSNMLDRSWRSTSKMVKDENPYSSLASSASYAYAHWENDNYGEIRSKDDDSVPRLSYLQGVNQFRISTIDHRFKGSTLMLDSRPKPEPMPDYDTSSASSRISSIYKDNHQVASAVSNEGYDDWISTPTSHKPSFYPQTRLSGPLNSVFRAFPINTPIVDPNCNHLTKDQPEGSTISGDSNSSDVSTTTTSPETESNDEAGSHIYSSISDGSNDGNASNASNQSKSIESESSDQYDDIKKMDKDDDAVDGDKGDQMEGKDETERVKDENPLPMES